MAIQFEKYVRITSGVVGNRGVRQRELIGRIFTENPLISPDEVLEFTDLDNIREFFGAQSEEYLRSQFYFAWISKQATRAKKISFARYSTSDIPPSIYGGTGAKDVSTIQANMALMTLTIDGVEYDIPQIDLSSADSLTDIASLLQTVIVATDPVLANATVDYDSVSRRFVLTVPGLVGKISVDVNSLSTTLQWTVDTGALFISGATARTPTDTVGDSAELTNNFGSFLFLSQLSDDDIQAVAAWNDAQNVKFMYCVPATGMANAQARYDALKGYSGTAVTLLYAGQDTGYPEMAPMIIAAATDYGRRNSTCNYMFQQFNLQPSVNRTSDSDAFDLVRCNYYGVTQTAGQFLAFYQRGLLMGGASAPVDMNTYVNEMWLKDLAGTQIMSLLLSLQKVSANERGRAQIVNILLPVIEAALFNGVMSVGKALVPTQKAFITEETGDSDAWRQVQNIGYWLNCEIRTEVTQDGRTEYYASYILIYSKDDTIKRVEGSHELI